MCIYIPPGLEIFVLFFDPSLRYGRLYKKKLCYTLVPGDVRNWCCCRRGNELNGYDHTSKWQSTHIA